jgi:hypothetical protein
MLNKWDDQQITKALKLMAEDPNVLPWGDRVWDRIETRLAERKQKTFWSRVNPMGKPYRMAVFASCFCAAFVGIFMYQQAVEQNDLASYILNVSDPRVSVPQDSGVVKASVLLSDSGNEEENGIPGTVKVPVLLSDDSKTPMPEVNFSNEDDDILLQI